MIAIFDPLNPPLEISQSLLRDVLRRAPRRLAFAGPAGAGKTTLCQLLGLPIINHADPLKEEVLTWLAWAVTRSSRPDSDETLASIAELLGLSPDLVRTDLWDLISPLVEAFNELLAEAYTHLPLLNTWTTLGPGEELESKIAFVDAHKALFRSSLQQYGQIQKELGGNPAFWAEITIKRALGLGLCTNGDTRFPEEAEVMRATGWTLVWLDISPETQHIRRPEMTVAQLAHTSENSLGPDDCDLLLDANLSLPRVAYALSIGLGSSAAVAA